jgi:hypothetical protein
MHNFHTACTVKHFVNTSLKANIMWCNVKVGESFMDAVKLQPWKTADGGDERLKPRVNMKRPEGKSNMPRRSN